MYRGGRKATIRTNQALFPRLEAKGEKRKGGGVFWLGGGQKKKGPKPEGKKRHREVFGENPLGWRVGNGFFCGNSPGGGVLERGGGKSHSINPGGS